MSKVKNDWVLNIKKTLGYCTNISSPKIAALYEYYRCRIGSQRFPMSDEQRFKFDKMIVNLCTEGYIYAEHWVLYNYFNIYKNDYWLESNRDVIPGKNGENLPYKDIKEELKLLCKLMKAQRINTAFELSPNEESIYETIITIQPLMRQEYDRRIKKTI